MMLATFMATTAVIAFLVANVRRYSNKKDGKITDTVPMPKLHGYISFFAAGVVTSNGFFHFIHGVLGYSEFPAPFAKLLGYGISTDISNIVWGFFNLTVAFILIIRSKKSATKWMLVLFFITGTLTMSILLRFVLLSGYFSAHTF